MIHVAFGPCRVHASGHAGYAPAGQDIVCAGLSALLAAGVETMAQMEREGLVRIVPPMKMEPGEISLQVQVLRDGERVAGAWELLRTGAALLQRHYGQWIAVSSTETD